MHGKEVRDDFSFRRKKMKRKKEREKKKKKKKRKKKKRKKKVALSSTFKRFALTSTLSRMSH
jgi:hypothetical protein